MERVYSVVTYEGAAQEDECRGVGVSTFLGNGPSSRRDCTRQHVPRSLDSIMHHRPIPSTCHARHCAAITNRATS